MSSMSARLNETRELQVVDADTRSTWIEPSPEDMKALRETIGASCNDAQFRVFTAAARHLGLDPWARQVVPIVQQGRMTVQTTIDGFRLLAQRSGLYGGQVGPYWCGPDGDWRDVWLDNKAPTAAKVGVIRRDFKEPMWGVARTAAYFKETSTWKSMPDVMIAKVAESLALRKAFPAELSGAYTAEELDQARREGDEEPFIAQARITEERPTTRRPNEGTNPSAAAESTQTAKPWNGLADAKFREAIRKYGYVSVAQTEQFLADAKRFVPNLPDDSREQARAYLAKVKADAERASRGETYAPAADAAGDGENIENGPNGEPEGEQEEVAYDLRTHPRLSGSVTP